MADPAISGPAPHQLDCPGGGAVVSGLRFQRGAVTGICSMCGLEVGVGPFGLNEPAVADQHTVHVQVRTPVADMGWPAVPDIAGEIPGFRAWRVKQGRPGIRLLSMVGTEWPPDDWMRATCDTITERWNRTGDRHIADEQWCRHNEPVPGVECTCGIYAARDRAELAQQWGYNADSNVVIGDVALAGRVIRGQKAHRAARARIVKLYVPHVSWRLVEPLKAAYKVEVVLTNPLKERA